MLTLKKKVAKDEPRSASKPAVAARSPQAVVPNEDQIRPLAYRKWQEAGCPAGDGTEFWLSAEAELCRGRHR